MCLKLKVHLLGIIRLRLGYWLSLGYGKTYDIVTHYKILSASAFFLLLDAAHRLSF